MGKAGNVVVSRRHHQGSNWWLGRFGTLKYAWEGYLLSLVSAGVELGEQSLQDCFQNALSITMEAQEIVIRGVQVCSAWGVDLCSAMLLCDAGNHCFLEGWPEGAVPSGDWNFGVSHVLERLEVKDGVVLQMVLLPIFCCHWGREGDKINQKPGAFWGSCYSLSKTCQQPPLHWHKPRSWLCLHPPALPCVLLTCMNAKSWNLGSWFQSSWSWE